MDGTPALTRGECWYWDNPDTRRCPRASVVSVTYTCPYCDTVVEIDRDAYLADKSVTREPLAGYEYSSTTGAYEDADGIEFVCIGRPAEQSDDEGCGRTFYLNYVRFEDGRERDDGPSLEDTPRFDFHP